MATTVWVSAILLDVCNPCNPRTRTQQCLGVCNPLLSGCLQSLGVCDPAILLAILLGAAILLQSSVWVPAIPLVANYTRRARAASTCCVRRPLAIVGDYSGSGRSGALPGSSRRGPYRPTDLPPDRPRAHLLERSEPAPGKTVGIDAHGPAALEFGNHCLPYQEPRLHRPGYLRAGKSTTSRNGWAVAW